MSVPAALHDCVCVPVLQEWLESGGLATWTASTVDKDLMTVPPPSSSTAPAILDSSRAFTAPHGPAPATPAPAQQDHAPRLASGRLRTVQPPECVWLGLKVVLQLMVGVVAPYGSSWCCRGLVVINQCLCLVTQSAGTLT